MVAAGVLLMLVAAARTSPAVWPLVRGVLLVVYNASMVIVALLSVCLLWPRRVLAAVRLLLGYLVAAAVRDEPLPATLDGVAHDADTALAAWLTTQPRLGATPLHLSLSAPPPPLARVLRHADVVSAVLVRALAYAPPEPQTTPHGMAPAVPCTAGVYMQIARFEVSAAVLIVHRLHPALAALPPLREACLWIDLLGRIT